MDFALSIAESPFALVIKLFGSGANFAQKAEFVRELEGGLATLSENFGKIRSGSSEKLD